MTSSPAKFGSLAALTSNKLESETIPAQIEPLVEVQAARRDLHSISQGRQKEVEPHGSSSDTRMTKISRTCLCMVGMHGYSSGPLFISTSSFVAHLTCSLEKA